MLTATPPRPMGRHRQQSASSSPSIVDENRQHGMSRGDGSQLAHTKRHVHRSSDASASMAVSSPLRETRVNGGAGAMQPPHAFKVPDLSHRWVRPDANGASTSYSRDHGTPVNGDRRYRDTSRGLMTPPTSGSNDGDEDEPLRAGPMESTPAQTHKRLAQNGSLTNGITSMYPPLPRQSTTSERSEASTPGSVSSRKRVRPSESPDKSANGYTTRAAQILLRMGLADVSNDRSSISGDTTTDTQDEEAHTRDRVVLLPTSRARDLSRWRDMSSMAGTSASFRRQNQGLQAQDAPRSPSPQVFAMQSPSAFQAADKTATPQGTPRAKAVAEARRSLVVSPSQSSLRSQGLFAPSPLRNSITPSKSRRMDSPASDGPSASRRSSLRPTQSSPAHSQASSLSQRFSQGPIRIGMTYNFEQARESGSSQASLTSPGQARREASPSSQMPTPPRTSALRERSRSSSPLKNQISRERVNSPLRSEASAVTPVRQVASRPNDTARFSDLGQFDLYDQSPPTLMQQSFHHRRAESPRSSVQASPRSARSVEASSRQSSPSKSVSARQGDVHLEHYERSEASRTPTRQVARESQSGTRSCDERPSPAASDRGVGSAKRMREYSSPSKASGSPYRSPRLTFGRTEIQAHLHEETHERLSEGAHHVPGSDRELPAGEPQQKDVSQPTPSRSLPGTPRSVARSQRHGQDDFTRALSRREVERSDGVGRDDGAQSNVSNHVKEYQSEADVHIETDLEDDESGEHGGVASRQVQEASGLFSRADRASDAAMSLASIPSVPAMSEAQSSDAGQRSPSVEASLRRSASRLSRMSATPRSLRRQPPSIHSSPLARFSGQSPHSSRSPSKAKGAEEQPPSRQSSVEASLHVDQSFKRAAQESPQKSYTSRRSLARESRSQSPFMQTGTGDERETTLHNQLSDSDEEIEQNAWHNEVPEATPPPPEALHDSFHKEVSDYRDVSLAQQQIGGELMARKSVPSRANELPRRTPRKEAPSFIPVATRRVGSVSRRKTVSSLQDDSRYSRQHLWRQRSSLAGAAFRPPERHIEIESTLHNSRSADVLAADTEEDYAGDLIYPALPERIEDGQSEVLLVAEVGGESDRQQIDDGNASEDADYDGVDDTQGSSWMHDFDHEDVPEAEQYAEDDQEAIEDVDVDNSPDSMIEGEQYIGEDKEGHSPAVDEDEGRAQSDNDLESFGRPHDAQYADHEFVSDEEEEYTREHAYDSEADEVEDENQDQDAFNIVDDEIAVPSRHAYFAEDMQQDGEGSYDDEEEVYEDEEYRDEAAAARPEVAFEDENLVDGDGDYDDEPSYDEGDEQDYDVDQLEDDEHLYENERAHHVEDDVSPSHVSSRDDASRSMITRQRDGSQISQAREVSWADVSVSDEASDAGVEDEFLASISMEHGAQDEVSVHDTRALNESKRSVHFAEVEDSQYSTSIRSPVRTPRFTVDRLDQGRSRDLISHRLSTADARSEAPIHDADRSRASQCPPNSRTSVSSRLQQPSTPSYETSLSRREAPDSHARLQSGMVNPAERADDGDRSMNAARERSTSSFAGNASLTMLNLVRHRSEMMGTRPSMVEVCSLNREAAARAAAILKQHHKYVQYGSLEVDVDEETWNQTALLDPSLLEHTQRDQTDAELSHLHDTLNSRTIDDVLHDKEAEIASTSFSAGRRGRLSVGNTSLGFATPLVPGAFPGLRSQTSPKLAALHLTHSKAQAKALAKYPGRRGRRLNNFGKDEWASLDDLLHAEVLAHANEILHAEGDRHSGDKSAALLSAALLVNKGALVEVFLDIHGLAPSTVANTEWSLEQLSRRVAVLNRRFLGKLKTRYPDVEVDSFEMDSVMDVSRPTTPRSHAIDDTTLAGSPKRAPFRMIVESTPAQMQQSSSTSSSSDEPRSRSSRQTRTEFRKGERGVLSGRSQAQRRDVGREDREDDSGDDDIEEANETWRHAVIDASISASASAASFALKGLGFVSSFWRQPNNTRAGERTVADVRNNNRVAQDRSTSHHVPTRRQADMAEVSQRSISAGLSLPSIAPVRRALEDRVGRAEHDDATELSYSRQHVSRSRASRSYASSSDHFSLGRAYGAMPYHTPVRRIASGQSITIEPTALAMLSPHTHQEARDLASEFRASRTARKWRSPRKAQSFYGVNGGSGNTTSFGLSTSASSSRISHDASRATADRSGAARQTNDRPTRQTWPRAATSSQSRPSISTQSATRFRNF